MGAIYSSKKFKEFIFGESDCSAEDNSRWKYAQSEKKKSRCGDSPVDNYTLLKSLKGGMEPEGKKHSYKGVTVHDVDEAVNERIFRSDAALQSSSSKYNSNSVSQSRCHDLNTPKPLKSVTGRKDSHCPQRFHSDHNEFVSIISDEENDDSTMSSDDLQDAEGSSGEQILEHEIISPQKTEMESSVVVLPEYVTYGRNCYSKSQLTFFCKSIRFDLSEEGAKGTLTYEPKTVDLISIESRWLDPFLKAEVCLRFKLDPPKSGILEVTFTVCDPNWSNTQERIKFLDEEYKEKWDVDLDSYESFEDVTYLEGDSGSISISKSDFQLLQPEKFINDTIVDFYIEYLKKIKPADARVHFFNSFFSRKLADFENQSETFDAKSAFERVRKWTKKVNIFQMDYIFVPVNFRLHWSLIVICHPAEVVNFEDDELANSLKVPCILHLDSIKGSHRGLELPFKSYLSEEWKERSSDSAEDISSKFMNLRFIRLEIPQQQNSYDCGLFMLHYMELFVKQATNNFNPLNNFISKEWFYPTEASLKRARIKRLIFELTKSSAKSPAGSDKSSCQLKDEEETDLEILDETGNSKETCCETVNIEDSPLMVKPLRSKPYDLCGKMDVNDVDGDMINRATSSLHENQSHCDEGDNGDENEQNNHGMMVLYDPSVTLSPIKEVDEDFEKQIVARGENNKGEDSLMMSCIDKSLNLLQLKENAAALIVEDSVECSSDDDVLETCVVEDSDSDEVVTGCWKYPNLKRRLGVGVVPEARKRTRRGSIFQ